MCIFLVHLGPSFDIPSFKGLPGGYLNRKPLVDGQEKLGKKKDEEEDEREEPSREFVDLSGYPLGLERVLPFQRVSPIQGKQPSVIR